MNGPKRWLAAGGVAAAALGCGPNPQPNPPTPTCAEKSGVACVYAGTGVAGFNGDGKALLESRLYSPLDMEFAPDGTPWIIDFNNHRLRTVEKDGTLKTRVGTLLPGDGDPDQADLTPAGAPGDTVSLNHPTDLAFDPNGELFISAWHNFKIRTWDPATGIVHVIAGGHYYMGGFYGDGGPEAMAGFNFPKSIVRTPDGAFYILDQRNFRIRKIGADGIIHTVAGTGAAGFAGDDDDPMKAQFSFETGDAPLPSGGLALAEDGTLYVADSLNHRIRKLDFVNKKTTTIAGTGEKGFGGDGGPATSAKLNNPRDLEFGPDGRLYIADTDNNAVRAIDLTTGTITTVAGTGTKGTGAEGALATATELNQPWGIAFDTKGALYIADTQNHRILKVPR